MALTRLPRSRPGSGDPGVGPGPRSRFGRTGLQCRRGDGRRPSRTARSGGRGGRRGRGHGGGATSGRARVDHAGGHRLAMARPRRRIRTVGRPGATTALPGRAPDQRGAPGERDRCDGLAELRVHPPGRTRVLRDDRAPGPGSGQPARRTRRADAAARVVGRPGGNGTREADHRAPHCRPVGPSRCRRTLRRAATESGDPVRAARNGQDQLRQGGLVTAGLALRRVVSVPVGGDRNRRVGGLAARGLRRTRRTRRAGVVHRRGRGDRHGPVGCLHRRVGCDQRIAEADPGVPPARQPTPGLRHQRGALAGLGVPAAGPFRLRHPDRAARSARSQCGVGALPGCGQRQRRCRTARHRLGVVHPRRH